MGSSGDTKYRYDEAMGIPNVDIRCVYCGHIFKGCGRKGAVEMERYDNHYYPCQAKWKGQGSWYDRAQRAKGQKSKQMQSQDSDEKQRKETLAKYEALQEETDWEADRKQILSGKGKVSNAYVQKFMKEMQENETVDKFAKN